VTADAHALTTTEHSAVATLAHDERGGISNPILGMILFLTSEVMFFAGLFAAYFNVRANTAPWPPINPDTNQPFKVEMLPLVLPATILLITSSVTCQLAVNAIRRNDRTGYLRGIALTLILGIVFLVMQATDYSLLYSEGVRLDAGPFGTTYFTLTGFHGAHVFGGVIMLSVILYRGMAGQFSSRHHDAVEATSLYWHFVDIVWIALFSTLYIL
jgi:cytochrome c oxidase subunit 3